MGNSGDDPDLPIALVTRALAMVLSGHLPRESSPHVLAGPGQRTRCALCAAAILPSDVEYEIATAPAAGGAHFLCFHIPCYHAWKQACLAQPPAMDEDAAGP